MTESKHCSKCKHIYWEEDGPHECPSPEYVAFHRSLIRAACEAEEMMESCEAEFTYDRESRRYKPTGRFFGVSAAGVSRLIESGSEDRPE